MSVIVSESPGVVITGASSGIGQATAEAFARDGARLVLGARDVEALGDVVARCQEMGAEAIAVEVDVTNAEAVKGLAVRAQEALGTIDVWVSNVGVGAVGDFTETPWEAHEQTVRTNLLGHMAEAHAVISLFVDQTHGTFINMISLGGFAAAPYATAYSASKFGLRGFTEALRGELSGLKDVHICDVYPSFADTPGLAHGANYTGRQLSAPPPVLDPIDIASAIVRLSKNPRATTIVGWPVWGLRAVHFLSPTLTAAAIGRFIEVALSLAKPAAPTDGNLFVPPSKAGGIRGGLSRANRTALIGPSVLSLALAGVVLYVINKRRGRGPDHARFNA